MVAGGRWVAGERLGTVGGLVLGLLVVAAGLVWWLVGGLWVWGWLVGWWVAGGWCERSD